MAAAGFKEVDELSGVDQAQVIALVEEFEELEKSASNVGDSLESMSTKGINFTEQMNHMIYLRQRELLVSEKLFKASTNLAQIFSGIHTTTDPNILADQALGANITANNNNLAFDRIKLSQEAAMNLSLIHI